MPKLGGKSSVNVVKKPKNEILKDLKTLSPSQPIGYCKLATTIPFDTRFLTIPLTDISPVPTMKPPPCMKIITGYLVVDDALKTRLQLKNPNKSYIWSKNIHI